MVYMVKVGEMTEEQRKLGNKAVSECNINQPTLTGEQ